MKLQDALKEMGISLDGEFDETSLATLNSKGKDVLVKEADKKKEASNTININVTGDKKEDSTDKKQEDTKVADYSKIKFNQDTGLFDLNTVEDDGLKAILQLSNDTVVKTANNVKINDAFNKKMADVKLHKGITADAVKSLIKMDNVKVGADGKVTGLDEAFENLKKEQSGLFVQRGSSIDESTPVMEGYHPAGSTGSDNSIDAALAALANELTVN